MLNSSQPVPTGSGTITYQWEIRPAATGNWGQIDGATSETLTPTVSGSSSAYRRQVNSTLNGVKCSIYSNIVTVTTNTLQYLHRLIQICHHILSVPQTLVKLLLQLQKIQVQFYIIFILMVN